MVMFILNQTPNRGGSFSANCRDLSSTLKEYKKLGNHYRRYLFARSLSSGLSVLDSGCGHGFGALLLDGVCGEYTGIDIDSDAIDWAKDYIASRSSVSRFFAPDEFRKSFQDKHFDLVLSFEVIEHVEDPYDYLSELISYASPHGTILISTPNGKYSHGDPRKYRTPYHLRVC